MKRIVKIAKNCYIKEAFFDIVNGVKCLVKHTTTSNAHGAMEVNFEDLKIFTDLGLKIETIKI